MERDALEVLLAEGLSLAAIGRRLGRHESTISYWVKRHGLRPVGEGKTAARGSLSREELEHLVEQGHSIEDIATAIGRSKATVRYWLDKHGLRTHRAQGLRDRGVAYEARATGASEAMLPCRMHGVVAHVREPRGYFRCRQCRREAVIRRRRKAKEILVAEAGGRCRVCGYNRSIAALEFHHLDPSQKAFGLSQRGVGRSIERLRAEARKCILLCSNCHAEVESGALSISG